MAGPWQAVPCSPLFSQHVVEALLVPIVCVAYYSRKPFLRKLHDSLAVPHIPAKPTSMSSTADQLHTGISRACSNVQYTDVERRQAFDRIL
eukprot:scaffold912_cov422-Prasinococcus_capsulatus_cf.AAC.3